MAIARTGVFVDDYLEYSSTLPAELQRLLSTMGELDVRSQAMINQTRDQTKYCLGLTSQNLKKGNHDEEAFEKMCKEIEANQENTLSLCTEKVLLARQAYELIDSHVKRLDEDLIQFAEDLKQEGKIAPDEPAILPPLPIVPREEKRRSHYGTPQSRKFEFRAEREWDRERDRDLELMPPPGSQKKSLPAPVDVDQPIDPNEPTYCVCHQVSFGDMIACDNENVCSVSFSFHCLLFLFLNKQSNRLGWHKGTGIQPSSRFPHHWPAQLSVKEGNGSIIRVWDSHLKQDLRGSGIVRLADFFLSLDFVNIFGRS